MSPPHTHAENHSAPPDVTGYTNSTSSSSDGIQADKNQGAGTTTTHKQTPKYGNAELMETGDGEMVFLTSPLTVVLQGFQIFN